MLRRIHSVLGLMTTSNSPFSLAVLFVATTLWQTISKEFSRMKKAIVCALLTLAIACSGSALYAQQDNMNQGGPGAGHRMMIAPEQRLQHLTKMLDLTADQQQKVKTILEDDSQQMQTLRQDTTLPDQDKGMKLRQLHQSTNDKIWAVLNADQQKKWQAMQDQRMERKGQSGMDHGGVAPNAAPPQPTNP